VLELGCGTLGGFVPRLLAGGYDAVGVDPHAPEGDSYQQVEFERYRPPRPVNALVASTSLHHVADLGDVLDLLTAALAPGGTVVVIEWASELFDEATARWCFARLGQPDPDGEPGWLSHHRDDWAASGQSWDAYFGSWLADEGLHPGSKILSELDARFDRQFCAHGPYFFSELAEITEADEQAAIDSGQIRATGIRYVGLLR
jgi:SAM-dependent methyltransferase